MDRTSEQEERKKKLIRRAAFTAGALGVGGLMWKTGRTTIHGKTGRVKWAISPLGPGNMRNDIFRRVPEPKPPRVKQRPTGSVAWNQKKKLGAKEGEIAQMHAEDILGTSDREELDMRVRAREAAKAVQVKEAAKVFRNTQPVNIGRSQQYRKGYTANISYPSAHGTWGSHAEHGRPVALTDAHEKYHGRLANAQAEFNKNDYSWLRKKFKGRPVAEHEYIARKYGVWPEAIAKKYEVHPEELLWDRKQTKRAYHKFRQHVEKGAEAMTEDQHWTLWRDKVERDRAAGPSGGAARPGRNRNLFSIKVEPFSLASKARLFLFEMRSKKDGKFRDENQVAVEQQSPKSMQDAYHKPSVLQRAAKVAGYAAGIGGTAYLVGKTDAGKKLYGNIVKSIQTGTSSKQREAAAEALHRGGKPARDLAKEVSRNTRLTEGYRKLRTASSTTNKAFTKTQREHAATTAELKKVQGERDALAAALEKTEGKGKSSKLRQGLVTDIHGEAAMKRAIDEGEERGAIREKFVKGKETAAARAANAPPPEPGETRKTPGIQTKDAQVYQALQEALKIHPLDRRRYKKAFKPHGEARGLTPGTDEYRVDEEEFVKKLHRINNAEVIDALEAGGFPPRSSQRLVPGKGRQSQPVRGEPAPRKGEAGPIESAAERDARRQNAYFPEEAPKEEPKPKRGRKKKFGAIINRLYELSAMVDTFELRKW